MRDVAIGGQQLPPEATLNFVVGATALDNPGEGRTDVSINPDLVSAITRVAIAGSLKPFEPTLNFVSGATAVDNPGQSRVDVTVTGSGGIVKQVAINGSLLPPEVTVNFVTGASAVDNAAQSRTDVTIQAGYSRVAQSGSLVAAETVLNFIGATVADDSGNGRTNVTMPGSALYGTHSLNSTPVTINSTDSVNTLYYFDTGADGYVITITETVGVPRVIFVANTNSASRNFTVSASTGQATPVSITHGHGAVLMYTGDATIGYLPLVGTT